MTVVAFLMYTVANIVGLLLFWLYGRRDKQKKPSDADETENEIVKKRRLKHQPSLLAILGLSHQDRSFCAIEDHFTSFSDVSAACKRAGLEKCGLIIGIDFTASNEWQGRKTFSSQCLHKVIPGRIYNPYQKVISIIGQTIEPFDDDHLIPAYGFGDSSTSDEDVFCFHSNGNACKGFSEVLEKYNEYATQLSFSGPTSFEPIISKAIEIVKLRKSYHILIIIADSQVTEESRTIESIVSASDYPLSIVVVGVGDGPWDMMEDYDDFLPNRKFDNFQFVNYHSVTSKVKNPDANLALHTMMEIPHQYKIVKALNYIDDHVTTNNNNTSLDSTNV